MEADPPETKAGGVNSPQRYESVAKRYILSLSMGLKRLDSLSNTSMDTNRDGWSSVLYVTFMPDTCSSLPPSSVSFSIEERGKQ